jgi:hypothetical protein
VGTEGNLLRYYQADFQWRNTNYFTGLGDRDVRCIAVNPADVADILVGTGRYTFGMSFGATSRPTWHHRMETSMSPSLLNAGRTTHLKIVAVALVAGIADVAPQITAALLRLDHISRAPDYIPLAEVTSVATCTY